MTLKTAVGIAFMIAFLLAGNILIFGLVGDGLAIAYFIFTLTAISVMIWFAKSFFEKKTEIAAMIVLGLLLSISAAFFAEAAKSNADNSKALVLARNSLQSEISYASQKNDYYAKYAQYYRAQIADYQGVSQSIESQISGLTADLSVPAPAQVPALILEEMVPAAIPNNETRKINARRRNYEEEEEWEDD